MPFHGQQLLFVCLGAYSLMVEHVAHNDAVAGSNPAKPIRQRKKKKRTTKQWLVRLRLLPCF